MGFSWLAGSRTKSVSGAGYLEMTGYDRPFEFAP